MTGPCAVEAQAVSVRAGSKLLLDTVTLRFAHGEFTAIIGPNGAGKTTLLRLLSGELKLHAGRLQLKGRNIASYSPRVLAEHRAVLSQNIDVTFPFTVAEVVRMGAGDRRGPHIERLVANALCELDLAAFSERVITSLSGGEQKRAHFARVLVQLARGEALHGPGVLMLDEPTAALDLRHQLDLLTMARRCTARGVAVIAILHDLNLAALFSDRIVVMDKGRVAGDGPPRQTITDEMLAQVFNISATVGRASPHDVPFVLPHSMMTSAQ